MCEKHVFNSNVAYRFNIICKCRLFVVYNIWTKIKVGDLRIAWSII